MSSRVMTEFKGIAKAMVWAFVIGAICGAMACGYFRSEPEVQPNIDVIEMMHRNGGDL
jgi:hypothetical protein